MLEQNPPVAARQWSSSELLDVYRALRLPRTIEEKMLRLIRHGKIGKWFSGYGQEAIAVGTALSLNEDDYILPMHRNLGVWTTRGVPLEPLFSQLLGKHGGFTKGRDRSFHFGLPEKKIVGMISQLGAMLPVACGLGLGALLDKSTRVAAAFVGEGATREGDFHEAVNLAAVWNLPVIFIVENNGYGLSTPAREALPVEDLADAAAGYGIPGLVVDGNDVLEVIEAVTQAADRARSGEGPTLLEMKTFRIRGHEEASGVKYVPKELIESWAARDPLDGLVRRLDTDGVNADARAVIDDELAGEVERAAEAALTHSIDTGDVATEVADVYAPSPRAEIEASGEPVSSRFVDAVADGLRESMRRDDKVVIMGQDIAEYGGVFKVTQGFLEEFGRERVRNTPIIESGIVGAALGLAIAGYKPVVEIQYADFIACCHNQIVNNLGTTHYRWGQPVNVTIRAPFGGHIGSGPFHSQSPEAWFCHVPGLKVVVPGSPADAKGLLAAAIVDPNPVLFFEHKYLYRTLRGDVPQGYYEDRIGEAKVCVEGGDATVVTWGIGVEWARTEATRRAEEGIHLEVVDLRTLKPWDKEAVRRSVEKTNRLLVLHEAVHTGGFGAEIAASIAEQSFDLLDAPPVRVASLDTPVPFSLPLEQQVYSAHSRFREGLDRLLGY